MSEPQILFQRYRTVSGMEPQPMKGLRLAESGGSSTEFTNSGDGPSQLKRKRSSSESAIWGMKRRRTTSREQSPTPTGLSLVKSFEGKRFLLEMTEISGETGYIHTNLKRKRSTSEPAISSAKRRKLASSNQPITWNSPSPVRSSERDAMIGHVKTSNQVQNIGGTDPTGTTPLKNRTRKSDTRPSVPLSSSSEVKQCLLTQELSTEASVEPCYFFNQRLWDNSELLTRLECWWGMEYNSLDPRSESNRIYLRRDWLKSFDVERWLLLPTPEIMEKVSERCDKIVSGSIAYLDQPPIDTLYEGAETFEYRMLPLDMELRSFNRINWHDPSGGSNFSEVRTAANQQGTRHYPPFHTLPTLVSHAKPHFVICDAGAKLYQRHIGPGFAALLKSIWQGHDFDTSSFTFSIRHTYDIWFARGVPARIVSTPRVLVPIPPLHPYLIVARRHCPTGRSCCGPCVHNRFAWLPTRCAHCLGPRIGPASNPNSAHSDSDADLDTAEPSDEMAQYRAYLRCVARRVDAWNSCCMQQVKKRGRWTSSLVNTKQLRDYAQESPGNLGQRGGTPCAGCCCHSKKAQPVRCDRGVQTSG